MAGIAIAVAAGYIVPMNALHDLSGQIYYGNTVARWIEALFIFLVLLTVLPLLRLLITRRLRSLPPRQSPTALELLLHVMQRTTRPFLLAVAIYFALRPLRLPPNADHAADIIIQLALWTQAGLWAAQAVGFAIDRRMSRQGGNTRTPTLDILRFVCLLIVWTLAALMLLSNLGVNITALVTGLGVGGVAVALAVQNVLGDLLASIAIALDKPFQIGDLLQFDTISGHVERIGIKSTHLRSIDGEQVVVSNTQLLAAKLRNFGRLTEQRIFYVVGVAPDTDAPRLQAFSGLLGQLVATLPGTRLERCYLRGFGNGALEYELWFYLASTQAQALDRTREQFNLALIQLCARQGITLVTAGVRREPPAAAVPAPAASPASAAPSAAPGAPAPPASVSPPASPPG